MNQQINRSPRLLFILANDFGELTSVMYFLSGQSIAAQSLLALPAGALMHKAQGDLGIPNRSYNSYESLIEIVDDHQPDIVLLFSGCLLPLNTPIRQFFRTGPLKRLIRHLQERKCEILSFDPLSGLSGAGPEELTYHYPADSGALYLSLFRPLMWLIQRSLRKSYPILRDCRLLYAAPVDDFIIRQKIRGVSFFNPQILQQARQYRAAMPMAAKPFWLFSIAHGDYGMQKSRVHRSKRAFVKLVSEKLEQTLRWDRRAVFIGPEELVVALKAETTGLEGVEIAGYQTYQKYLSLLHEAEYAFYWNAFSMTLFHRLLNGLPSFFFDKGHVAESITGIYERHIALYYCGREPTFLNPQDELNPDDLKQRADSCNREADTLVQHYDQSPSPDELIDEIVRAG